MWYKAEFEDDNFEMILADNDDEAFAEAQEMEEEHGTLDKCFICKKEFEYNDMPFLALIRGHKNSFICENCAKKVNSERTGEQ